MRHEAKALDMEKRENDPSERWNLPSPVRRITPFSVGAPRSPNSPSNARRETDETSSSSSSSSSQPMLPPHVFLTSGTSSNSFLDMSSMSLAALCSTLSDNASASPVSESFPLEKKETSRTPNEPSTSRDATAMPCKSRIAMVRVSARHDIFCSRTDTQGRSRSSHSDHTYCNVC